MKKADLIIEINKISAEYLGFPPDTKFFYPTNLKIEVLNRWLANFNNMISLHRQAKEIKEKYTDQQRDYFAITDTMPDDLKMAYELSHKAELIWLKKF